MWEKVSKKVYPGIKKEDVWKIWSDIENWPKWNPDLEYCELKDSFETGGNIDLKPKSTPMVKLTLEEVVENEKFTDCTHLPGAKMYGKHEMRETTDGLEIKTTMSITGMSSMMWVGLVGEKIAAKMPDQMDALVNLIGIKE